MVWVNSTNQFDAACGFGGVRESGFGREGGREGMVEYLKLKNDWGTEDGNIVKSPKASAKAASVGIDQTPKNYIGGKQARPDGGTTQIILNNDGSPAGRVGVGNRKDIRNAVEAAFKNDGWSGTTAHNRAQVIYYMAENLNQREEEYLTMLRSLTGGNRAAAKKEFDMTLSRLFAYGGWADKFDGLCHSPPGRFVSLAVNEPVGVMGIVCPDLMPLLSFISLLAPVMAMGNRAVVVPSERYPLLATTFYQILETSDVPPGVVNIVTGPREELALTLAEHDQVEGLWYHGSKAGSAAVEKASAANLKRTWVNGGRTRNWLSPEQGEGRQFLQHATQVKNIWLPYGD